MAGADTDPLIRLASAPSFLTAYLVENGKEAIASKEETGSESTDNGENNTELQMKNGVIETGWIGGYVPPPVDPPPTHPDLSEGTLS